MGKFLRPKAEVLPNDALVPDKNMISPAPTDFTHELTGPEPYYFSSGATKSNGEFPAGTKLRLMDTRGSRCWVADERGLYVEIECAALRKL
jgi:hypothetical protein